MHAADWAQVGSAAFTAVTAGTALVAVRQSQRAWRTSQQPLLSVEISHTLPTGVLHLHVANVGGPVKKTMAVVVEGEQAVMAFLPPTAFLATGEHRSFKLGIENPDPEAKTVAVVYGFDLAGKYTYAWAANGQERRWRVSPRWRTIHSRISAADIMQKLYPGTPDPTDLELRQLKLVTWTSGGESSD